MDAPNFAGAGAPAVTRARAEPPTLAASANLDFLRSIAVLSVLVYHVGLFFQVTGGHTRIPNELGHWGVLMFFMHTTLVLMGSLERLRLESPRRLYERFIVRRLFRLLPLSTFVVLFIGIFDLPVGHLHDGIFRSVPHDLFATASNLLLIQNVTNAESFEAPLWSLPYEMQLYFALPLLFAICHRSRSAFPMLVVWAFSVLDALFWKRLHPFLMPGYLPCFLSGAVAYALGRVATGRRIPFAAWPICLVVASLAYFKWPLVEVGWFACLTLAIMWPNVSEMPRGLVSRLSAIVARYSYGVYLAHFPLIWFAFVWLGDLPAWIRIGAFVGTSILCPVLLYHAIERPLMSVGTRLTHGWSRDASVGA